MIKYSCVYTHDVPFAPSIIHDISREGKYVVRPHYLDLRCDRCGKVDERQALARGVDKGIRVSSRRDAHQSDDDLHIVSELMRTILETVKELEAAFFAIPSNSKYFVAMAQRVYLPIDSNPAFQCIDPCPSCGRFRDVVWGNEKLEIRESIPMGAVHLENRHGIMPVWFFAPDVVGVLKNTIPKLTGLFFEQEGKMIVGP